jgi:hypothetical protein
MALEHLLVTPAPASEHLCVQPTDDLPESPITEGFKPHAIDEER